MDQLKSPFELALRNRAAQITEYRFQLQNERSERRKLMAIEIKGLKADALTARANLDKLRAAYAKFNEAAPAHAADVEGLATTIGGMQSDLEFAATVMGNSAGESEKLASGEVYTQVVKATDGMKAAPESIVAQQTAITDRVALGPHPDQPEVSTASPGQVTRIAPGSELTVTADQDVVIIKPPEAGQTDVHTFRAAE